jgi:predicted signal transduction protein with EAL and GGDEF domain
MADKGLVEFTAETVRKTGLDPSRLELEITESAVMSNQDYAEKVLNQFKELGFHLTMDDFGTGYSSLAYLKRFPFDSVKIDQSFVRGIPANSDDVAIVEAIIAMAHSLQLKVVAEGVETEEQLNLLRKLGCDTIQGYYFSKPIPSNEVVMLLFKIMKGGGKTGPGGSPDVEGTPNVNASGPLRPSASPPAEAETSRKVALAAVEAPVPPVDAVPAAPVAPPTAPPLPELSLEPLELKIELPADLPAQAPAPKAKEA